MRYLCRWRAENGKVLGIDKTSRNPFNVSRIDSAIRRAVEGYSAMAINGDIRRRLADPPFRAIASRNLRKSPVRYTPLRSRALLQRAKKNPS